MASRFDKQLDEVRGVESLFGWVRVLVTGAGFAFGLVFTWLQLQKYSLLSAVHLLDGQTLIRISLIVYYYAWVLAQTVEVQMSRTVYVADPNRGKVPLPLFFVIPTLIGLGILLFVVQDNPKYLSVVFSAFFVVDLALFLNVRRLAPKYEAASAKIYEAERAHARLVQLRYYVRAYLRGQWQYYRFAVMAFVLILFNICVHIDFIHQQLASEIQKIVPTISSEKSLVLIPGCLFACYIAIAEGWMWSMRMRARRTLLIVDELRTQYKVSLQKRRAEV